MSENTNNKRVLLVEDDMMAQMAARIMLQECGLEVDTVDCGQDAVDAATNNDYLAIFMDYGLPDFRGDVATQKIRAAGIKTPIIALTANSNNEVQTACETAGMNLFLQKPITVDCVNEILEKLDI